MIESKIMRDQDWVTVMFVVILFLWVVFKTVFYKNYKALGSLKEYLTFKENFALFTTFFSLIATLVYALMVYVFCLRNDWPVRYGFTSYRAFFFFFICLSFFSLFRILLNNLIFYLFNKEYHLNTFYMIKTFYEWRFLKVFLFLEMFMMYAFFYDDRILYLVFFVFIRYLALFRGLARVMGIPVYHIMLYICSLEVLPILVLFKYMIGVKR